MELREKCPGTKECRVKDFHMVVYGSTEGELQNTEPPLGVWQSILSSNRKEKIRPTPSDCLHSPKYRHSLYGEPDHVGEDRDAIFHCSNPHGIIPF